MATVSPGKVQRSQRLLLGSNATDAAGRTLSDITIDLLFVGTLGATAMQMGVLNALGSLAFVLASIPAGHWVDKYSALRVLRIGLGSKLFLLGCLAALSFAEALSIPLGMLLCALLGFCNVFSETSQTTAVPQLIGDAPEVRTASISKLVASLGAADQSMTVIVPALAGTGFAMWGAPALLSISAALGLLALLMAVQVRSYRAEEGLGGRQTPSTEQGGILAGLRYLARHRLLLAITVAVTFSNLGLAIGSSVEAIFIINELGFGEFGYGLFASIGGVGGLIGAAIAGKLAGKFAPATLLVYTGSMQAVLAGCVLAAAFTAEMWSMVLLGIFSLGWGIVVLLFNIAASSWVVQIVPEHLLGRVLSARRLFTFGVVPVGGLAGGALASAWGIAAGLLGWVVAATLAVISYLAMRGPATR
ncbi:MFS transporter [Glutamicibacter sp.]|uniref:MFS transporter n=1 Tax=Glutamicibacter sp. TaxID=1931995 RepID=UPI003D6B3D61